METQPEAGPSPATINNIDPTKGRQQPRLPKPPCSNPIRLPALRGDSASLTPHAQRVHRG